MKRYFPIGTVVLLKDSERRVMIVGLRQQEADSDKIWDYSGCLYPEGIIDSNALFLFDEEQIDMLFFIGFQDGESLQFLDAVNRSVNEPDEQNDSNVPSEETASE